MKIIFVHEVNYLEKPIFEMHEFPEYLSLQGLEVSFLHFPEGWTLEEVHSQGYMRQISGRVKNEARINLLTPQNASGSMWGRLKTAITFRSFFRKVMTEFKPDIIVSFSVPTSGWQALIEARNAGVPFVFRALDVSHKIRRSVFSPIVRLAERFVYRKATYVSANNPAMREYCISMGAKKERVGVHLPPLDLDHFSGADSFRAEYRARLGFSERDKVLVYMGTFFYFSGLPEVLKSFTTSNLTDLKLLLIGGGEQEQELKSLVEELGVSERVKFTGFVSYDDLPKYLGAGDVAINSMHRTLAADVAFPNKVIQYMASGLSVVSTDLEGLRKTFGYLPGLRLVSSSNNVVPAALEFLRQGNLNDIGKRNQAQVANIFSREVAVREFENLLRAIGGKHA